MSLASAQKFVSTMKIDQEFRVTVANFSEPGQLLSYLQNWGYEFAMSDLIQAMAACMTELDQCCSQ